MIIRLLAVLLLVYFVPSRAWAVCANEPAGSQFWIQSDFNSYPGGTGFSTRGGNGGITSQSDAPKSPPNVLYYQYNQGMQAGISADTIYVNLGGIGRYEIYECLFWKASPGWDQEENSGTSKISFYLNTFNSGDDAFYGMSGPEGGPYRIQHALEFAGSGICNGHTGTFGDSCGGTRVFAPNATTTSILAGSWYEVETYSKYSSCPTCRDGILRWWVNGNLNGNYTNVNYPPRTNPGAANGEWALSSTWGGLNNTKQSTDFFYFDYVKISFPNCPAPCGGNQPPIDNPPGPPGTVTGVTVTVQ